MQTFFGVLLITSLAFLVLMGMSWLTISSINILAAKEIIEISWYTVLALSWLKLWFGFTFSNIIKVGNRRNAK